MSDHALPGDTKHPVGNQNATGGLLGALPKRLEKPSRH
jgi:hypothetical protein